VGRGGIKRRKAKHPLAPAEDTGILADLEDQAAWSSYGQGVPRLGNPRRDAIWWRRGWRRLHNFGKLRSNLVFRDRGFWPAMRLGFVGVVLIIAAFATILILVDRLVVSR
jgi:hypothetical protein